MGFLSELIHSSRSDPNYTKQIYIFDKTPAQTG